MANVMRLLTNIYQHHNFLIDANSMFSSLDQGNECLMRKRLVGKSIVNVILGNVLLSNS